MIKLQLSKDNQKFTLNSKREFTISFIGAWSFTNKGNFKVEIKDLSLNKNIHLNEIVFKEQYFINCKKALKYYTFRNKTEGEFEIRFINIENLEIHSSKLFLHRLLFGKILFSKIELLIN